MRTLVLLCLVVGVAVAAPVFDSSGEFDSDDVAFRSGFDTSFEDDDISVSHIVNPQNIGVQTYSGPLVTRRTYSAAPVFRTFDVDDDDFDDVSLRFASQAAPVSGVQTYSAPVVSYSVDDDDDDDDDKQRFFVGQVGSTAVSPAVQTFVSSVAPAPAPVALNPTPITVQTYSSPQQIQSVAPAAVQTYSVAQTPVQTYSIAAAPASVQTYSSPAVAQNFGSVFRANVDIDDIDDDDYVFVAHSSVNPAPVAVQQYSAPVATHQTVQTFSKPITTQQTYTVPSQSVSRFGVASPTIYSVPVSNPVYLSSNYISPVFRSFVKPQHYTISNLSFEDDD